MKEEHLLLLDQLKQKDLYVRDCGHGDQARPRQPTLPFLMFMFCLCAAIVRVILGVASCTTGAALHKSDILPNWLLAWTEQACHYLGAVSCAVGLFIAGKNSLYPEDAGHLLLWLALTVILTTSDLATSASSWLDITRERVLVVDAATVVLSAICCWRKRVPRHWMAASINKRPTCQPETRLGDSQKMDMLSEKSTCSTPSVPSDQLSDISGDGTVQFENVQQNLESLSLGLTRRSWSSSSIWSLPAVVSTSVSEVIPDSTTDKSAQFNRKSHSVLSPSRLGFLNMDSVLRDRQSQGSTSSSTLVPQGSDSLLTHSSSDNRNQDVTQTLLSFSSGLPKPVQLSPVISQQSAFSNSVHKSAFSKNMYRSAFRSPKSLLNPPALFQDSGPCDSQTPDSLLQLPAAKNQLKSHHDISGTLENTTLPWTSQHQSGQMFTSHDIDTFKVMTPGESGYLGHSIAPRRSQRTLVTGKLPKPWPLKKSLSCCNLWGQEVQYDMGPWRQANLAASKHKLKQNDSAQRNSAIMSHLTPAHEAAPNALISHAARARPCHSRIRSRNLPARTNSPSIPEFSDDEFEDETSGQPSLQGSNTSMGKLRRNDVSWPWLLVGAVMGASLACNIFLAWQSWFLAHAD